jgi:hypothetical protein
MNTVLRLKELLLAEYDYQAQIEQKMKRSEPANPQQERRYQHLYKLLVLLENE